ncbi:MAG: leucine-rich repeat protein [Clostridia bacterium]|nr:leucine-rich repeat protein [Clostridia bacterium]
MKRKVIFLVMALLILAALCVLSSCSDKVDYNTIPEDQYIYFYVDGKLHGKAVVKDGKAYDIPLDPIKTGYEFMGWYGSDDMLFDPDNVTLNKDTVTSFHAKMRDKYNDGTSYEYYLLEDGTYLAIIPRLGPVEAIKIPSERNGIPVTAVGKHPDLSYSGALREIVIPEGVTRIEDNTFSGAFSLETLTLPESLTAIGKRAFFGCSALKSVVIPDNVISIGDEAFSNCTSLSDVSISPSVAYIGTNTFLGCSSLWKIICPSRCKAETWSDTWSGDRAEHASFLTTDEPITENEAYDYMIIDGEAKLTKYKLKEKSVVLPEYIDEHFRVTSVGEGAFSGSGVEEIKYSENLSSLDPGAFSGCNSLRKLAFTFLGGAKDGSKKYHIGYLFGADNYNKVFDASGYDKLASYVPSSLTEIEILADTIIERAFYNCTSIKKVILSENVKSIMNFAFDGCSGIEEVYSDSLENWVSLGFYSETSNPAYYAKTLYIGGDAITSDMVVPEGITEISSYAFAGFDSLTSVTLPDSIEAIGSGVFRECANLKSVKLPAFITTVSGNLFRECSSLASVELPSKVSRIEGYAFYKCASLSSIALPDSVRTVENYAFSESGLSQVALNEGLTSIGYYSFSNCEAITEMNIPLSVEEIGSYSFYSCDSLASVRFGDGGASMLKIVADYAFQYCDMLREISLPEGAEDIGQSAFCDCRRLVSVTVPSTVKKIGSYAFDGCISLNTVFFSASEATFGDLVFNECFNLVEIVNNSDLKLELGSNQYASFAIRAKLIHTGSESLIKTEGDYRYFTLGGKNYLCGYVGTGSEIALPEMLGGEGYEIHDYAFYQRSDIKKVTIPGTAERIGEYAFGYSGIESVDIGEGVIDIKDGAFYRCLKLTSVNLPNGLKYIKRDAFALSSAITEIVIPSTVTFVGKYAFNQCSSLKRIVFINTENWYRTALNPTDSGYSKSGTAADVSDPGATAVAMQNAYVNYNYLVRQ